MKVKHINFILLFLISLPTFVGCSNDNKSNQKNNLSEAVNENTFEGKELLIAAAGSLNNAFNELKSLFEAETGAKLTISFGSSGQLAEQITNGAPFDVFASADVGNIDRLKESNLLIDDTKQLYALGRLGIATMKEHSIKATTLNDLLNPEIVKISIANPALAPYGLAAKQAFQSVGIWDEVEDKMVYGQSITDALSYLESGNVEVALIASSLHNEVKFNFELIEESLHEQIGQSIAVVKQTNEEELSRLFIEFIKGPIGKPVMEKHGFLVP